MILSDSSIQSFLRFSTHRQMMSEVITSTDSRNTARDIENEMHFSHLINSSLRLILFFSCE